MDSITATHFYKVMFQTIIQFSQIFRISRNFSIFPFSLLHNTGSRFDESILHQWIQISTTLDPYLRIVCEDPRYTVLFSFLLKLFSFENTWRINIVAENPTIYHPNISTIPNDSITYIVSKLYLRQTKLQLWIILVYSDKSL